MRKRSAWTGAGSNQLAMTKVRVAVKPFDRASFEEFVDTYFPGCEGFLIDYVDFLEEAT